LQSPELSGVIEGRAPEGNVKESEAVQQNVDYSPQVGTKQQALELQSRGVYVCMLEMLGLYIPSIGHVGVVGA